MDLKINENWNKQKGKLMEAFTELTDRDLQQYKEGQEEQVLNHIQEKTGRSREVILKVIRQI